MFLLANSCERLPSPCQKEVALSRWKVMSSAMQEAGLDRFSMAKRTGMSPGGIYAIMTGLSRGQKRNLKKIDKVLGTSLYQVPFVKRTERFKRGSAVSPALLEIKARIRMMGMTPSSMIQRVMKEKKMTKSEVAQKMGVVPGTVDNLLSGKTQGMHHTLYNLLGLYGTIKRRK